MPSSKRIYRKGQIADPNLFFFFLFIFFLVFPQVSVVKGLAFFFFCVAPLFHFLFLFIIITLSIFCLIFVISFVVFLLCILWVFLLSPLQVIWFFLMGVLIFSCKYFYFDALTDDKVAQIYFERKCNTFFKLLHNLYWSLI